MADLNGNERAALIGQLIAMRNVLDGVLASLQEEQQDDAGPCEHPLDARKYDKGAMGSAQRFVCQQCGQTVTPEGA